MQAPSKTEKQTFMLAGHLLLADDCIQGFFLNPVLPANFGNTANTLRNFEHMVWWMRPYIVGTDGAYTVQCLDGGAWDRPTWCDECATLDDAVQACKALVLRPKGIFRVTGIHAQSGAMSAVPIDY